MIITLRKFFKKGIDIQPQALYTIYRKFLIFFYICTRRNFDYDLIISLKNAPNGICHNPKKILLGGTKF